MQSLFKRLGLNAKETETFLKLLELGPQPVSVIAKNVSMPRSTMYFILDNLKKVHLLEEFERKGIKYVRAIPAKSIEDVLRNRERDIEQTISLLHEKLPELESLESKLSITPQVKFFEGKEEVMKMYAQIIRQSSFSAFVDLASVKQAMPEYHDEIPKMIKEEGGKARELVVASPEASEYMKKYSSRRHQIKILPEDMTFQSDEIICKDRLYMTAYGEEKVSAVQIYSVPLAKTQQVLFDRLWEFID